MGFLLIDMLFENNAIYYWVTWSVLYIIETVILYRQVFKWDATEYSIGCPCSEVTLKYIRENNWYQTTTRHKYKPWAGFLWYTEHTSIV